MTKSRKNPSKSRSKPKGRPKSGGATLKTAPKAGGNNNVSRGYKSQICGMSDPFCDHALGSKHHDGGSARTLSFPQHQRVRMQTTNTGLASLIVIPSYKYKSCSVAETLGASDAAWFSQERVHSGSPECSTVRLVSYGIVVRNVVAPLHASGMVRIRGFASKDAWTLVTGVDVATYNCDFSSDVPLYSTKETCVIGRRVDDSVKLFKTPLQLDPDHTPQSNTGTGFGFIVVSVDGGPDSYPCLDVEVFLHWEITFRDTDELQQITTASLPQNVLVETATRSITSYSQNVFTAGLNAASTYIERLAERAIAQYGVGAMAALL